VIVIVRIAILTTVILVYKDGSQIALIRQVALVQNAYQIAIHA